MRPGAKRSETKRDVKARFPHRAVALVKIPTQRTTLGVAVHSGRPMVLAMSHTCI